MTEAEQLEQINVIIDKIRPYLQRDGGDVSVECIKDGILYVSLLGACVGCGSADVTLKEGIEAIIIEEVPGIIAVEAL